MSQAQQYDYFSIAAAAEAVGFDEVSRLPFSMKVLLENLVRLDYQRAPRVRADSGAKEVSFLIWINANSSVED